MRSEVLNGPMGCREVKRKQKGEQTGRFGEFSEGADNGIAESSCMYVFPVASYGPPVVQRVLPMSGLIDCYIVT